MDLALIELENIQKIYRAGEVEVCALGGVTLSVEQGEFRTVGIGKINADEHTRLPGRPRSRSIPVGWGGGLSPARPFAVWYPES